MPDVPKNAAELDRRIAAIRENLRELVERAAGSSGAADDELVSQRIAEQQSLLDLLTGERDQLMRGN
jgi:hypothetical protein